MRDDIEAKGAMVSLIESLSNRHTAEMRDVVTKALSNFVTFAYTLRQIQSKDESCNNNGLSSLATVIGN